MNVGRWVGPLAVDRLMVMYGPQPLDRISRSLGGLSAGLVKRLVPETPQYKPATVSVGPSTLDDDGHYCRNRSI